MKLKEAIGKGEAAWSHYTAWQVVLKNLRRLQKENKQLRRTQKSSPLVMAGKQFDHLGQRVG
jgi:hypothetical protein